MMTTKISKSISKMIALLTASSCLFMAGCSGGTPAPSASPSAPASTSSPAAPAAPVAERPFNEDGTFPVCKELVELTVMIPESPTVEDFATNFQTKMMETQGNFKLNIITAPAAEYKTKVNLMMAGGKDLPDVIMTAGSATKLTDSMIFTFAQAGSIVPLTEYYENAYFIKDAMERTGENLIPKITSPDGEIYYVPTYNQSISNDNPSKLYMNPDWLAKLNKTAPTTPDELYDVLKAFKTGDPNGNGKADEIPLMGDKDQNFWFTYLMNPFTYAGTKETNYLTLENGKLSAAYSTEGWREGLRYMKKLVSEELLSPLTLTQDGKARKILMAQKDPDITGAFIQMGTSDFPADDPRRVNFIGVAPLKGANGTDYATYTPADPTPAFVVTKACKNPEAAFKLGDLMCSEELSIHTRWGEKGVDWLVPVEGDVAMYDALGYKPSLKENMAWGKLQNKHWSQTGPYIRQYSISGGVVSDTANPLNNAETIAKAQMLYMNKEPKELVSKLIYTAEESEAVSETMTSLINYVHESRAAFITGAMDIEKDWDSYLKELDNIGLQEVLEVNQTVYDRMYK